MTYATKARTLDDIATGRHVFSIIAMDQRNTLRRMFTAVGLDASDDDLRVAKADEVEPGQIVVHDADDLNLGFALSRLSDQDLTHTVTGIFRNTSRTTYDDAARAQVDAAVQKAEAAGGPDLQALLHGRDTWTVVG